MAMNKKGNVFIILLALVAVVIVGGYVGILNTAQLVGTGQYIERPVFKWIKCEQTSSTPLATSFVTLVKDGEWTIKPSNTDQYTINVKINSMPRLYGTAIEYSICNTRNAVQNNCRIFQAISRAQNEGQIIPISDVKGNEFVFVKFRRYDYLVGSGGLDGASYQLLYSPYGLREYNVLGGGAQTLNPNSCTSGIGDDNWVDRFISSDSSKINQQQKPNSEISDRTLQPNEIRNFVAGYVTSASPSFALTYKNQEAWCKPSGDNAKIFKINTITTGSGTYKVASVDWSDELGTVICCPGDKQPGRACNNNFQWVSTQPIDSSGKTAIQCSAFNPCQAGEETPYGAKALAKYSCVSGSCVLQTRAVECSSDADCRASNQLCDVNQWKCVEGDVNLNGQKLDIVPDNKEDCEKKGYNWVTEKTTNKEWYNYLGIGDAEVVTKSYCDTASHFPWGTIAFWLVLVTLIVLLIYGRSYLIAGFSTIRSALRL